MKSTLLLLITALTLFTACEDQHHWHTSHRDKVHCYRHQNDDGTWVYWYLLWNSNQSHYYYYSSPTPVTSFSSVTFSQSDTPPFDLSSTDYAAMETMEVDATGMPADIANETSIESVDVSVDNESGQPSSTESAETSTESTSNDDGGGSESGSSDGGGSGDSGGGDGGGGD